MLVCQQCGYESPDGLRFCGSCGARLPEEVVLRQTRKVVTALFCDVTGSTALGEELDPEVLRGVLNQYFAVIRATIERHGGTVEKFIGDAVMAVFGIPVVREDDALRAVRAAAEIRERLPAVVDEAGVALRFRTGVNTGEVLMSEGENYATGDAVNIAARLEQAAAPGEIVLGAETLRLVRDAVQVEALEPLAVKGKAEPVEAFRLVSVDPLAPGLRRHLETELVGRQRELRLLRESWERVRSEEGCHLFTLLGVAGVGKSRLVAELFNTIGDEALVLRGRCLSYGEGITFWPLVEALAPLGDAATGVTQRLTVGGVAVPEEMFWEVRRFLESLAAERPVVLHIDDLQWGEQMLFDLLDHIVDLSRGAPILVLCTARPELLEDRPNWGGGKLNAQTVLLEPLGGRESQQLLEQLGGGLDDEARDRVIAASEGNPLFLEEMASLARESGEVTVPATIQALLAARLERLGRDERALLERGAVEGEVFHRLAIRALADGTLLAQLDQRLAGLVRRELIRPHPATFPGDEAYRFRHLLIRDAAYDALPKADRARLHEAFADWLERGASDLPELDEIAGWHQEQAVHYRQQLGQQADPQLAERAARHLLQAGQRAGERCDAAAAVNLLQRARGLTTDTELSRLNAQISVELAKPLIDAGDFRQADAVLTIAERESGVAAEAALARFELLLAEEPEAAVRMGVRLPSILEEFQRRNDERGIARAYLAQWSLEWICSRAGPAAEHALRAAEHARRAGDDGLHQRALGSYRAALHYGENHIDILRHELVAIEDEGVGPFLAMILDMGRGTCAELDGELDAARDLVERAVDAAGAIGMQVYATGWHLNLAAIAMLNDDPDEARATLQRADRVLASLGERANRSTIQAMLAEVELHTGRREAARAASDLSESLSAPQDVINFAFTHAVRAMLAQADGDLDAAEQWARSSVRYAYETDFYRPRGRSRLALSHVLAAQGRTRDAENEARTALETYVHKGDKPRTALAHEWLAVLQAPDGRAPGPAPGSQPGPQPDSQG
jgi:class 3 adenylate cyclase